MLNVVDAFILLLVIMDPILSMCAIVAVCKHKNRRQFMRVAYKAVGVAALVFFIFAFGGSAVLNILGVSLDSFRVAGGIILAIMGIQMVLGLNFKGGHESVAESAVVIGTPLIAGPAVITTTMILVKDIGLLPTLFSGIVALFVMLLCLVGAQGFSRLMGRSGLQVLSTMMGIVTVAWGIQFIVAGVMALI